MSWNDNHAAPPTVIGSYICLGDVMGECGIQHRTYEAAQRHIDQLSRSIARMPGNSSGSLTRSYCDRRVVFVPQGEPLPPLRKPGHMVVRI